MRSDAEQKGAHMAFTNEQHRKRYADDKEHRARKLADNKVWRTEHSKELNAAWSERWRTDPEFRASKQAQRRLRKYGLTPEQYQRMVDESNGLCIICKLAPARGLCVDHDHRTKKVRGLPCSNCNSGIGFFADDTKRMREAADYVDRANGILVPRVLGPGVRVALVLRAETGHFLVRGADAGRRQEAGATGTSGPGRD
jgi:hypothetical protein